MARIDELLVGDDGRLLTLQLPSADFITTGSASAKLGISNNQVHALVARRKLRSVRVQDSGGTTLAVYVHAGDLDAYAKLRRPRV